MIFFDMARYLVGDEVEKVFAVGAVRVDPQIGKAGDIDERPENTLFRIEPDQPGARLDRPNRRVDADLRPVARNRGG